MRYVLTFDEPVAADRLLTGGKGANLGLLAQAGFDVPPGFAVTTAGYTDFIDSAGLSAKISGIVAELDYADQPGIDARTEEIRELILATPMPTGIAAEIRDAYTALGDQLYVAVRSSGTAEDLEGASFAGQHDTYLDILGAESVIDAVRRCWASLWTPRATVYRHQNSAEVGSGKLAMSVVVQQMVPSEVSGVMFTGNPLTTATDEIVINASWGLGEMIVQGAVTPDEFIVRTDTLAVLDRNLGTKELRMDRDPAGGTVTADVAPNDQARFTLDDRQVRQLAELGRRVQQYYRDMPQDIEWGFAAGAFYLLQARPITGVEFSWDVDVEQGHELARDDDAIWSRCWADSLTNGVVTPLTYSARFVEWSDSSYPKMSELMGFPDLAQIRTFKYWKGGAYFNLAWEQEYVARSVWPALRPQALGWTPTAWQEELLNKPFSPMVYLKALARVQLLAPQLGPYGFFKTLDRWRARTDVDGLPAEELRPLSDRAVKEYTEKMVRMERDWADDIWPWSFFCGFRDGLFLLHWMVDSWFRSDTPAVFGRLISGTIERTDTHREGDALRALAEEIRNSTELSELFATHSDRRFFAECEKSPEGQGFLANYRLFLRDYGHRGHADRDVYYPRHLDDPAVTYGGLHMLLSSDLPDAETQEAEVNRRREDTFDEVVAGIRRLPFGSLRVELFKTVFDFVHRNLLVRDNERWRPTDNLTYAYKKGFVEIGRRVFERGLIDHERDFYFCSKQELYALLDGHVDNHDLLKAKIAARARDCDRVLAREQNHPMYLHRNRETVLDEIAEHADGVFVGSPTSSGTVQGTARVIKSIDQINTLRRGDVLIVNSTDPGWNPVFHVVAAVVVETGGNLSHASCLSREFGLPAVHLPQALRLIPDGASVEVNGNTGRVTILDDAIDEPVPAGAS